MIHRWDELTFLHWSYDPAVVQALLPSGLTVETYNGQAWVGLVPFLMEVRTPRGPALPWISHFCETNVRTYVTAPDGSNGVWFLSLDAARLAAVATARTTYRLPYFWSRMRLERTGRAEETDGPDDREYDYICERRWPGPVGTRSRVRVRVAETFQQHDLTEFDHYLTARWRLYSARATGLRYALAHHDPWPLHRAEALEIDDELITAAGLPAPKGAPIVHWSPGVEVRIGFPRPMTSPI